MFNPNKIPKYKPVELPSIKYRFSNSKHIVYCYHKGMYYEESIEDNLMNQFYIEALSSPYVISTLSTKLYHLFSHETHRKMSMNFAIYLTNKYVNDINTILGEN